MFARLGAKMLAAVGAVLALVALIGAAWWRGHSSAAKSDAAKAQAVHDHEMVQAAQDARQTVVAAQAGEDAAIADAHAAPAPDADARTDFESRK